MAEKILALLIAFLSGIALTVLIGAKLINLSIRHSPRMRKLLRDTLDREDARHAIVGDAHLLSHAFDDGVLAGARDGKDLCEVCIDPIDKPFVDEGGAKRWRPCPNSAAHTVTDGRDKMRVCEEHYGGISQKKPDL